MLLSFISGAGLVSLFDTRIKKQVSKINHRHHCYRGTRPPDPYSKARSWIGQHGNGPKAPGKRKAAHSDDEEEYHDTYGTDHGF
ncbi:hypothetical protein PABG_01521 [Paracoccidioides brasiliensis Pb03]|nr:hypothetical protein PABG_01521 [Paracoccidioides brasiliensis Pb03]